MKEISRRNFLKFAGVSSATVLAAGDKPVKAAPKNILADNRMGALVDTTTCIGCRKCEWACKTAHDMPTPSIDTYADRMVFNKMRRPDDTALTIVNEYKNDAANQFPINVKFQCMHCDRPACVSACIVGAFTKEENGAVIWDTDKCIGCRYCMVACPFQIPAFEFSEVLKPDIKKCDFCFDRTQQGLIPACSEICPMEVITYGRRKDLIDAAHQKIKNYPDRYLNHVFGEEEVGGTSWLYLASKDFNKIGFPKLGKDPAPGVSEAIQHGIFAYFVPPIALYALLGGVMWINKNKKISDEEKEL
ncbi:MAG: 4Fe-4S dicluster domain-containing protein [Melioribacteraceae bacterium]|jgi:Fe-S-cluster-containing dehydrogenase component|nr:4Fe-4S dicluster domain-containing protein [Melioribacteraceae bacterium]